MCRQRKRQLLKMIFSLAFAGLNLIFSVESNGKWGGSATAEKWRQPNLEGVTYCIENLNYSRPAREMPGD